MDKKYSRLFIAKNAKMAKKIVDCIAGFYRVPLAVVDKDIFIYLNTDMVKSEGSDISNVTYFALGLKIGLENK